MATCRFGLFHNLEVAEDSLLRSYRYVDYTESSLYTTVGVALFEGLLRLSAHPDQTSCVWNKLAVWVEELKLSRSDLTENVEAFEALVDSCWTNKEPSVTTHFLDSTKFLMIRAVVRGLFESFGNTQFPVAPDVVMLEKFVQKLGVSLVFIQLGKPWQLLPQADPKGPLLFLAQLEPPYYSLVYHRHHLALAYTKKEPLKKMLDYPFFYTRGCYMFASDLKSKLIQMLAQQLFGSAFSDSFLVSQLNHLVAQFPELDRGFLQYIRLS